MSGVDIILEWDVISADVVVRLGDVATAPDLKTAVMISLFTDRRAANDDIPAGQTDPRGWWGDVQPVVEGDQIGSRLWLLDRQKQTEDVRARARTYALEALQWLVTDGVASAVDVETQWLAPGTLGIGVTITQPHVDPVKFKFSYLWSSLEAA